MSQPGLLSRVADALAALGIEWMLTGSLVSSAQGQPRSTHDIDVVVLLPSSAIPGLLAAFPPPDFYLSEPAVREAVARRSMFNLLSLHDGDKVDFWLLTDEPFDVSRFARKRPESVQGVTVNASAPEDTILVKLRWAKLSGGSERQFTDALRVYELQAALLDHGYLERWVAMLGVEESWHRLRAEAKPVPG